MLQVFAQILEAHVIENTYDYILLQKEYQNDVWSLDVARAAQEDTSIVHSLVPSEPEGGKWDDRL